MALLLADLGITESHSRPHTSIGDPFSESHFKTLRHQPEYPKRFGCIEDARTFCLSLFDRYDRDRHHSGLGLMTPDRVHHSQVDAIYAARQSVLDRAFTETPQRSVRATPEPPAKRIAAWIDPPPKTEADRA